MSLKYDITVLKYPRRDWTPHEDSIDEIKEVHPVDQPIVVHNQYGIESYYISLGISDGYMHPNGKFYTRNFGFWKSKDAAEDAVALYLNQSASLEIFI